VLLRQIDQSKMNDNVLDSEMVIEVNTFALQLII